MRTGGGDVDAPALPAAQPMAVPSYEESSTATTPRLRAVLYTARLE
jgi:hypothetical protein